MAKNSMKLVVAAAVVGGAALYAVKSAKAKAKTAAQTDTLDAKTGTPIPAKLPAGAPVSKDQSQMSPQLKKRVASALSALSIHPFTGNPTAVASASAVREATTVIGQLEAEGFYTTAMQMRGFVDLAQKYTPTPKAPSVAAVIPPGLSKSQKEYILRTLGMERSPRVLQTFKTWMGTLPPSAERDAMIGMAEALIVQTQAATSTASSLDAVADVVNAQTEGGLNRVMANAQNNAPLPVPVQRPATVTSPGLPQPVAVPRPAPVPLPAPVLPTRPAPAAYIPPPPAPAATAAPVALPEQPAAVPKTPKPQPAPPPLTPLQITARAMVANIKSAQSSHGGPTSSAKRSFDKSLVRKFQKASGGGVDGKPGPATYLRAAALGAVDLPLVMYWPRRGTHKTVRLYRSKLRQLADTFAAGGRTADANRLRISANYERGQGGIPGGPLPA